MVPGLPGCFALRGFRGSEWERGGSIEYPPLMTLPIEALLPQGEAKEMPRKFLFDNK
jgi:hypothetical protein